MATKWQVYKPLPKKHKLQKYDKYKLWLFDYKKYVNIDELCKNLQNLDDENLYEAIAIYSKKHYKYRDFLYYNLKTLTMDNYDEKTSNYTLDRELNNLYYKYPQDIYHELLHLASSQYDVEKNIFYSGFSFTDLNNGLTLGEGLNEGYVELLCDEDNFDGKFIHDIDPKSGQYQIPYSYVKALAKQLQLIIGKERLEEMFFNEGFNGLKKELMKYRDEKSVLEFFRNCDAASLASCHISIILNKKAMKAQNFLKDLIEQYKPELFSEMQKDFLCLSSSGLCLTTWRIEEEYIEIEKNKKVKL